MPPLLQLVGVLQRLERDTPARIGFADPRDHCEIARGEVDRNDTGMLHADPDLERALPDVVDPRLQDHVARDVRRLPQQDVVDRRRDHPPPRLEATRIGERRLFRELVQDLEDQVEADVAREGLVHDHEPPPQRSVRGERQREVTGGLGGPRHRFAPPNPRS